MTDIDVVIAENLPRIRRAILKKARRNGLKMKKLPDGIEPKVLKASLNLFISKIIYALLKPDPAP